MNSSHPALDDPCPCGSGKMYGYCCLLKPDAPPSGAGIGSDPVFADLHEVLADRDFGSLDELQGFTDDFMDSRNRAALDDFQGLSPEQMSALLYSPFDSPHCVTFPECIAGTPVAPILSLFLLLTEAIGEQGLKCTAKGNLPRAFCREAAALGRELPERGELRQLFRVNKEEDYFDLHVTRIVALEAGLIRKYKGRFKLTRECQRLLEAGSATVYPRLLRAHVQHYNWAYGDSYSELPFIQQSFLFTLYLLQRHGWEEKPHLFYEDAYLQAFPMLVDEAKADAFSTPAAQVKNCYTLRTLQRFAGFLGLAEVEHASTGYLSREYRIRKTPLLDQAVQFHF